MNSRDSLEWISKFIVSVLVFVILFLIANNLYINSFTIINKIDNSIYHRAATDNKYSYNVYFNESVINETNIIDDLMTELPKFDNIEDITIQRFTRILYENESTVEKVINKNEEYKKYLDEKATSVKELIIWCENISKIDEYLFITCNFITNIVFLFILVYCIKLRKTYYFLAAALYLFSILSIFSKGITDYLNIQVLNLLNSKIYNIFSIDYPDLLYEDMIILRPLLFQSFKESILTFLMFDTAILSMLPITKEEISKSINSIDYIINFLERNPDNTIKYKLKFSFSMKQVISFCKKTNKFIYKKDEKIDIDNLMEKLSKDGQTTQYHLQSLKEIRCFLCKYQII